MLGSPGGFTCDNMYSSKRGKLDTHKGQYLKTEAETGEMQLLIRQGTSTSMEN